VQLITYGDRLGGTGQEIEMRMDSTIPPPDLFVFGGAMVHEDAPREFSIFDSRTFTDSLGS